MQVEAILEDITDIEVDAIVNSCNTRMKFGNYQGSVSGVINNRTNGRLEKKIYRENFHNFPLPLGKIIITDSDNLPCRKILHLATHGNFHKEWLPAANKMDHSDSLEYRLEKVVINTIQEGMKNIFSACDDQEISSLAVPLIGSGTLKLNPVLVVEIILAKIDFHFENNPDSRIENIKIVTVEKTIKNLINELIQINKNRVDNSYQKEKSKNEDVNYIKSIEDENQRLKQENSELKEELQKIHKIIWSKKEPTNLWKRLELPAPLAYAQQLRVAERDYVSGKFNMISAIGIITKYFSSLACAEYIACGCFDEILNEDLNREFKKGSLTDGTWNRIGYDINKSFLKYGFTGTTVREIPSIWTKIKGKEGKFYQHLKKLVELRNEIHDTSPVDRSSARQWLLKTTPEWDSMCEFSSELTTYEIVYVDHLLRFDRQDKSFIHVIRKLSGGYFIPPTEEFRWESDLDEEKLYLYDPRENNILPLHPFLTYEYSSVTNNKESYCLEHFSSSKLQFRAFRMAHKHQINGQEISLFTYNEENIPHQNTNF